MVPPRESVEQVARVLPAAWFRPLSEFWWIWLVWRVWLSSPCSSSPLKRHLFFLRLCERSSNLPVYGCTCVKRFADCYRSPEISSGVPLMCGIHGPSDWELVGKLFNPFGGSGPEPVRNVHNDWVGVVLNFSFI